MQDFETRFASVETALDDLDRRLRELQGRSRRLRAAARAGDLRQLHDTLARLDVDRTNVQTAIDSTAAAWPFSDGEETAYLRDAYAAELVQVAARNGLDVFERDGRLLAFPALIRVDPAARRVRINKRQLASLRPSALVGVIKSIQAKASGFNAQAFINVLWRAWRIHCRGSSAAAEGVSRQVGLLDIHETLTLLPAARKDYDLTEFGRDLLLLDESGVISTSADRTQHQLQWLRASTTSKGGRYVSTVDRNGQQVGYAAIEFRVVAA